MYLSEDYRISCQLTLISADLRAFASQSRTFVTFLGSFLRQTLWSAAVSGGIVDTTRASAGPRVLIGGIDLVK